MRRGYQVSLFGEGAGRGRLFQAPVLRQYLEDQRTTPIPREERKREIIRDWLRSLEETDATETTLEQNFAERILSGVLGYTIYPPSTGEKAATLYPKPSSRITGLGRTPDHILGHFSGTQDRIDAVLELKTPGRDLDAPQPSAKGETPVEQAFYYGTRILGVRWVLVSDMRVIRLYSVESEGEYELFDLMDCLSVEDKVDSPFRRLHFLLHNEYLVQDGPQSTVARLHAKSAADQIKIRDSFYEVYTRIRSDLYSAIEAAVGGGSAGAVDEQQLLQATQRLLDRLLFIYYCEDHPEQLVPNGTVDGVVQAAQALPGSSSTRIYEYVKQLFREVDSGSEAGSGLSISGYNGELFKYHPIVDEVELPDTLARKIYSVQEPDGRTRRINGVYGLHVYDFWSELNEHLLGHIFEESLSDLEDLTDVPERRVSARLSERKRMGVYYTSSLLSDFLSSHAIASLLEERAPLRATSVEEIQPEIERRREALLDLRIADFACGSGAFLVSAYRELLLEFWRLRAALRQLKDPSAAQPLDMFKELEAVSQAQLLRTCLFGVDLLPQAVEIAKLALWLRSARKGEAVADLTQNLIPGDSLQVEATLDSLNIDPGTLDIVLGNPPWGGEIEQGSWQIAIDKLDLDPSEDWDSWELFVALGIHLLRDGGRLSFVLPDSFLYPEKARTRELLLSHGSLERILVLGPEWFGPNVRMGSLLIQFRKGQPSQLEFIQSTLLAGHLRRRTLRGEVPLTQVEAQRSREIPAVRIRESDRFEIEVFRGARDDKIMDQMRSSSTRLVDLCSRARGEEINKAGLLWICPSCGSPNTPGAKAKGGGYKDSSCAVCEHTLKQEGVDEMYLVQDAHPVNHKAVPYIDGDDINRRYRKVTPSKWFRTDVSGWGYKDEEIYDGPKLLIRQAGVGLFLTLDETNARCPQSVYLYRLTNEAQADGYTHHFLLAALSSRTMAYFLFKRFGEVDPDKAHAKVTHTRLADLPIPQIDMKNPEDRQRVEIISRQAGELLEDRAALGDGEDREIELHLRQLWGLSPEDGAYINREFFDLPDSQIIRDLFPHGRPSPMDATSASAFNGD